VAEPLSAPEPSSRKATERVTGGSAADDDLAALGPLLDRLEDLLAEIDALDAPVRDRVFELLDGFDAVHRLALTRLADRLGDQLGQLRDDAAVDWLFQAYGVGVDDIEAAEAALETVRPLVHEHGGEVAVLAVDRGVVRLRLDGSCAGCTSAADTLRYGVEQALREHLPGFVALDVVADDAAPHPPPSPQVLLQITPRPV